MASFWAFSYDNFRIIIWQSQATCLPMLQRPKKPIIDRTNMTTQRANNCVCGHVVLAGPRAAPVTVTATARARATALVNVLAPRLLIYMARRNLANNAQHLLIWFVNILHILFSGQPTKSLRLQEL